MGGLKDVEALARSQFGVVSREQLIEAGLGNRSSIAWKLKTGELERVHEHIYRLRGAPASWERQAMEGLLLAGKSGVLSHQTAAWLHRLDGFQRPAVIDITAERNARRTLKGIRFHRPRSGAPSSVLTDLWPITTAQRTIVDLAGELTPEALEIALDSAQRRYRDFSSWLSKYLEPLKPQGTPGLAVLLELIKVRGDGVTDSPLETKVRRKLRQEGLLPTHQFEVYDGTEYVMRLDFAWVHLKVAIHVDGYRWHHQRERFDRDARQRSRLQVLGWRTITVTATTFKEGTWLTELLALLNPQSGLALV